MNLLPEETALEAIERLIRQTENKKIEWKPFGAPDDEGHEEYLVKLKKFKFYIRAGILADEPPIVFQAWRLPPAPGEDSQLVYENYNYAPRFRDQLERLFPLARESALNIESLAQELLQELE